MEEEIAKGILEDDIKFNKETEKLYYQWQIRVHKEYIDFYTEKIKELE